MSNSAAPESGIEIISEADLQRDIICAYLVRASEPWIAAKAADIRAGGFDAALTTKRASLLKPINGMLDELIQIPGVRKDGTL